MFLEYISNMYVLSLISTIVGLCILYLYDKFEKKQYTNAIYCRIGILIFLSCLATVYISRLNFFQSGGGNSISNITNVCDSGNSYGSEGMRAQTQYENFKTGVPTF